MSELYNVNMSSSEALMAFLKATDGMSKEEYIAMHKEYRPYASAILKKELELAQQGILICG